MTGVAVGMAYRPALDGWLRAHLGCFDILEITIDDCILGNAAQNGALEDLVGRIPLTAHGVGLSIGTDAPIDFCYLDQVAAVLEQLRPSAYSEHLAFTRVPGCELGNLLPVPKNKTVAMSLIAKIKYVQDRIRIPFLLENIAYMFEWPDSTMSDAAFLNMICQETGAGLLLDVENLYLNSCNHGYDPHAFIDDLALGLVKEIHLAGGMAIHDILPGRPFYADTHSHPVPESALDILEHVLARQSPVTIILERDDRLDSLDEVLTDLSRIRSRIGNPERR